MVMIRCPSCGQSALDVASTCPHCGHVLLQNPLETGEDSHLASCTRCGKHIDRRVAICPYCGHHVRRVRLVRRTTAAAVALVAVVVGVVAALRTGLVRLPARAARPAVVTAPATGDPLPARTPQAAPIRAAPPATDTAAARPVAAPPPAQPTTPAQAPPANAAARWTADWANVRAARSPDAPVVRVLRPGMRVSVADLRSGWWMVFVDGTQLGYIANSVLTSTPPGP